MPETVHTISDYWDGPLVGVADYHGKPHTYSCNFDQAADDWTDTFTLQPLNEEGFRLAMEQWAICLRWQKAF